MKKITLQDIAHISGCTVSTVSRALHGNARISQKTRDKIIQLAKDRNYFGSRKERVVAIIGSLADFFPDYYMQYLLFRIARELNQKHIRSITIFFHDLSLLNSIYISGVISLMPFHRIARSWSASSPVPMVTVNDYSEKTGRIFSACSDEALTVNKVVKQLIAYGCRRPAFFSTSPETYCSKMRLNSYLQIMEQMGFESRIFAPSSISGSKFLKKLIECDSFILPGENLSSLTPQLHARMPDAILAVWRYTPEQHPNEICVTQDYAKIAEKAVSLLENEMDNRPNIYDEHICCKISSSLR